MTFVYVLSYNLHHSCPHCSLSFSVCHSRFLHKLFFSPRPGVFLIYIIVLKCFVLNILFILIPNVFVLVLCICVFLVIVTDAVVDDIVVVNVVALLLLIFVSCSRYLHETDRRNAHRQVPSVCPFSLGSLCRYLLETDHRNAQRTRSWHKSNVTFSALLRRHYELIRMAFA